MICSAISILLQSLLLVIAVNDFKRFQKQACNRLLLKMLQKYANFRLII